MITHKRPRSPPIRWNVKTQKYNMYPLKRTLPSSGTVCNAAEAGSKPGKNAEDK